MHKYFVDAELNSMLGPSDDTDYEVHTHKYINNVALHRNRLRDHDVEAPI